MNVGVLFGLLLVLESTVGAKILVITFTHVKGSRTRNLEKLAAILADSGHEIVILADSLYKMPGFLRDKRAEVVTYPRPDTILGNNTEYKFSLGNAYQEWRNISMKDFGIVVEFCEALVSSKSTMKILKREKFDLLLVESMQPCYKVIASYLHGTPVIEFLTFDIWWKSAYKEYALPLSYLPLNVLGFGAKMNFFQRLQNVVGYLVMIPIHWYLERGINKIAEKHGILMKQVDALGFVYGGYPVEYPSPSMPDIIHLNGMLISQPKPIPNHLEMFVSSGTRQTIIASFGSMIKEYDQHNGALFGEAFKQVSQNVIWKYQGLPLKNLTPNIKLLNWIPQTDLLARNSTKVFITHCGMNSAYEAVYYGVPVVAVPLYGDQIGTAAMLVDHHRIGVKLDIDSLTAETLAKAINEVVANSEYKKNAMRLSEYLKDQPMNNRDLMLYWVDYVIRHKGVAHLKPYGKKLTWYQFYLVDIVLFLFLVLFIVVLITFLSCKCFVKCIKTMFRKSKLE